MALWVGMASMAFCGRFRRASFSTCATGSGVGDTTNEYATISTPVAIRRPELYN